MNPTNFSMECQSSGAVPPLTFEHGAQPQKAFQPNET